MNFIELLQGEGIAIRKMKGEYIFMQGEQDESLYYIKSGLLKAYYTSVEGKSSIKSFLSTGDVMGSLAAIYENKTCSFSLICLEETQLVQIPFSVVLESCKNDLEVANNIIEVLINFGIKKEEREFEFLCLSAEDRFRKLKDVSPELLTKVTQNDLAHYLGVTPVGLSRIKKRLDNTG